MEQVKHQPDKNTSKFIQNEKFYFAIAKLMHTYISNLRHLLFTTRLSTVII